MKIVIIINSFKDGGAERVASLLANNFSADHSVYIITRDEEKNYFYTLSDRIIKIQIPIQKKNSPLFYVISLAKIILHIKPDIIISFMTETNILTLIAATIARVLNPFHKMKIKISERTDPREQKVRKSVSFLRKVLYPVASEIIVQTESVKSWASDLVNKDKVKVIPNPANYELLKNCRDIDFVVHTKKYILSIGRLSQEKGHDLLIEAFQMVLKNHPELDLLIVGDGPNKQLLNEKVFQLGLSKNVFFMGRKKNVYNYLKNAELFVLPSRYEGFPNVLAEALVTGTPSISNDCKSGPADLLKGDMSKYLVKDISPKGIADKINFALSQPDLKKQFEEYSALVKSELEINHIAKKWIE